MSNITSALIKELREKTGAGLMDCKKALTESSGDMRKAEDWIKEKGLLIADKKSDRVAAEGLLGLALDGKRGIVVEVNSETDFVSKNESFIDFVQSVTKVGVKCNSLEELKKTKLNSVTVEDELISIIGKIRENLVLRRLISISTDNGNLFSYMHSSSAPNIGRIAVIIDLEGDNLDDDLGKKLCMHIAAFRPLALNVSDLSADIIEREKAIAKNIIAETNKPSDIQEKMLAGKMQKYYKEVCLMDQPYLMDDKKSIKEVLQSHSVKLNKFIRVELGEGIEKQKEDFAAEVEKAING